jgi:LytS/YehU family sensor histidine kinase
LTALHNAKLNARHGVPLATTSTWGLLNNVFFSITYNFSTALGIAITIKLMKRWWVKQRETALVMREKANAELQLLKAQVHPHFLFNSLNNIYSFALEGSSRTPEMIRELSGLLHYMLYDCKQPLVPLEKELKLLNDYLSLEKIRYGDRLKINIQMPQQVNTEQIAPLLLIPFVENSFKHGTSKMLAHPFVMLNISMTEGILYLHLSNSKPSGLEEMFVTNNRGLGLRNVKKRLELLYPGRYELEILNDTSTYTVWLKITLSESITGKLNGLSKKEMEIYELA